MQQDSIPFETQAIARDNMNLVDLNDGSKLPIDLPCQEFDSSLKASLDLRSETCVKALMTDLGLEEIRAVVHYQVMQRQLLTIAVMRNQLLMDGPEQGKTEIKLLDRKPYALTVPNHTLKLKDILTKAFDGTNIE